MKRLLRLLVATLALATAVACGGYLYLLRSLPLTEGEITVAGIEAPVEILRDAHGIPHIFAHSIADATFALGFAHAQDRLWQMEISRRIGSGRLSEVLGPSTIGHDRLFRTLGARRAAQANLDRLDDETRRLLEAYAKGVNAFLATEPVLPPEFWILGVTPEPWSPVDSITWTKMMAWDLGGNWRSELLRMQLATTLPTARIQELLPPYPGDEPLPLPDLRALYDGLAQDARRLAQAIPGDQSEGAGSNNWVVRGGRSASGKPLLANDPHLELTAPSVWYFAHMRAPGLNAIGATLAAVPGIALGRNDRVAWAFTNTGPDVQDLYLERLDGADGYLAPDGPRPFRVIEEEIKIKDARSERLRIRITRHGPVISDVLRGATALAPNGYVLAFAWTALAEDDATVRAALKLAEVRSWNGFLATVRDFHTPQLNMVYADIDGNVGFVAAGRVPIRRAENALQGRAPAPGWDARYDWTGFIPFDELPRVYNPPAQEIVTANQKIVPEGYPHFITSEWQPPYRARRIHELLDAVPLHTLNSFARIQTDVVSLPIRELMPRLTAVQPLSEEARVALELLGAWDATMAMDGPEPLIAAGWWRELTRALYADELGEAFQGNWRTRAQFVLNVLTDRGGQSRWCDDVRTPGLERCEELLSGSLEAALADLRNRYGSDMGEWRWGKAHVAHSEHRPLGRSSLLAKLFDIRVPSPGDAYTVNVGRNQLDDEAEPFASRHAASLRAIYDLADPQASLFIHSGGQSGNPLSPQYSGFSGAWAAGEYLPMITDRGRLEAAGARQLVLAPRRDAGKAPLEKPVETR